MWKKQAIIDKHNEYRRKVAAGEAEGLPKATSMPDFKISFFSF